MRAGLPAKSGAPIINRLTPSVRSFDVSISPPSAHDPMVPRDTAHIIVRSRDVETYEEVRVQVPVAPAGGADQVLEQLITSVEDLHPGARYKSFDGKVASFVASKYLVVAKYVAPPRLPAPEPAAVPTAVQGSLFDG